MKKNIVSRREKGKVGGREGGKTEWSGMECKLGRGRGRGREGEWVRDVARGEEHLWCTGQTYFSTPD